MRISAIRLAREKLGKGATNHKDEVIADKSCIGKRTTEHKSRLSTRAG